MRILIFAAARPERLCSIAEIARAYGISKSHLMKVVTDLVTAGYLEGLRGRKGGIRLARPASHINVGEVVRHTEGGFDLVDCGSCMIARACGFTGALNRALAAFMEVLDGYTLDDLMGGTSELAAIFAFRASADEDAGREASQVCVQGPSPGGPASSADDPGGQ